MVVGDGRKYLAALVGIEYETVGDWALRHNLPYTTYRDLSEKPEVVELIQEVVDGDERAVRLGRADQAVPAAAQGARPRGRRADGDAEAEAGGDARHVRRARGVDVPMTAVARLRRHASRRTEPGVAPRTASGSIALGGSLVALAYFVIYQLVKDPSTFFQTLMKSLALGSVYAIIALGFVLIFKATQTVNFSQGALAMCGALFLSFLVVDEHIPFTTWQNPIMNLGGPSWLHVGAQRVRRPRRRGPARARHRAPDDPPDDRRAAVLGRRHHARPGDHPARVRHRRREDPVPIRRRAVGHGLVHARRRRHQLLVHRRDGDGRAGVHRRVLLLPLAHGHRHARRRLRPGGGDGPGHQGRAGVRHRLGGRRRARLPRRDLRHPATGRARPAPSSRTPRSSPSGPCRR